jgi:hypothetical protein
MSVFPIIDSLRSGLARNAIVCVGDMFKHIGKHLEPEMDFVVVSNHSMSVVEVYCSASEINEEIR